MRALFVIIVFAFAGIAIAQATRPAEVPPAPKDKDGKVLPTLEKLAAMKGDAKRGAAIYRDEKTVNCLRCHQIGDEGGEIGPPLTTIGEKLSRVQLLDSIVYPSNAILMGFENWFVKTKDGEVYTGLLTSETDDVLSLKDIDGKYIDVQKDQIVTKKQQPISIMPEGLNAAISQQDLVDLLEYLTTLKNQ
ncbi:c-type cytochrome [Humisphaera borealis]|uniref:C-type cytochrome n=1 Tax=Humisphaera borealis TaxID=2807512 RepID=A0A7M2WTH8_9BACT|nr:c-type cytochrome [Humisphaera borealis]QOV88472.1 c-type cytochrome [Humisphaera borealis]